MPGQFWIETLGCPKNAVDSDKLTGSLLADGYVPAAKAEEADLVVVNTCAFIEAAREESVDTILELSARRHPGARLVVTGCLAARSGEELVDVLPEVDLVADVGVPVQLSTSRRLVRASEMQSLSLMELPRSPVGVPWAYVRVAEGCDRACGFCAIPSFRGPQRSRALESVLAEVEALSVSEIVLVSQDLASYGRDLGIRDGLVTLLQSVAGMVDRVRLLYLYPSALNDRLVEAVLESDVPYFDLSLQHVSMPLLRRMRRWGSGERFLERIAAIRDASPTAAFRSSFIIGYPGEREEDHDELLAFLEAARLDWTGLFSFSPEEGTYAKGLDAPVPSELALERLREASAVADRVTFERRRELVGERMSVLVDRAGVGRSTREAPEIDGIIEVPLELRPGTFHDVEIVAAAGPDLSATLVAQEVLLR